MKLFSINYPCPNLLSALLVSCALLLSQGSASGFPGGDAQEKVTPQEAGFASSRETTEWLNLSFSTRVRYEAVNNRFKLGEDPSDRQLPLRTRIGVEIKEVTHPFRFKFEFEDSRIFLNDSGSTVNLTMRNEHDILQAYAAVDFGRKSSDGKTSTLYIGRQSFDFGSRRLFVRNRFRNTTNRYDGVRFSVASSRKWSLDTFFFMPVLIDMDRLDRRFRETYLWGGYFTLFPGFGGSGEVYYFGFDARPAISGIENRRYSTIGGRLQRESLPGRIGYELESIWQFGRVGELDHFAHLQHIELEYCFDVPWEPSVTGMYNYASGDRDPYDDRQGNFNTLFGARRFEYGPTGILNWMYRTNINSPAMFLLLKPFRKLQIRPMLRWLWLAQARAPWFFTDLVDPTGKSGTSIG